MNEQQYVTNIIKAINEGGGKAVKFVENEYSEKGTPDIIGSYNGRMIVVEAKVDDNNVSVIQGIRLDQWFDAGAISLACWNKFSNPKNIINFITHVVDLNKKYKSRLDMQLDFDRYCI